MLSEFLLPCFDFLGAFTFSCAGLAEEGMTSGISAGAVPRLGIPPVMAVFFSVLIWMHLLRFLSSPLLSPTTAGGLGDLIEEGGVTGVSGNSLASYSMISLFYSLSSTCSTEEGVG